MAEKYFTRYEGDDIVVTRQSDRKSIGIPKADCTDPTGKVAAWLAAIALAKACDDSSWG